jgi:signal transduction histidine kinase
VRLFSVVPSFTQTGRVVDMDREAAFKLLSAENAHDRLRAARYFSKHAKLQDHALLQKALLKENVIWVKGALRQSVDRCATLHQEMDDKPEMAGIEEAEADIGDVYAQAIEDVTRRLVHEVEPILGAARLYASKEIPEYQASGTKRELDRLESLLRAVDTLSRAAGAPMIRECDLAEQIRIVAESENLSCSAKIEFAGPSPLVIETDDSLVKLVVANGIRNAIEATESMDTAGSTNRIVISWGETDRDYWIAVVDWGPGLPLGIDRIFEIGSTTKKDHLGMGLAIAERAALSLGGKITLNPREDKGSRYEFRWPRRSEFYSETSSR